MFRSRLARRVSLRVFASVVVIEIIILVPSYYRRQQELSQHQLTVVERTFVPTVQHSKSLSPNFAKLQQQYQADPNVLGIKLYRDKQEVLSQTQEPFNDTTTLNFAGQRSVQTVHWNRTEVAWNIPTVDKNFVLVLRLDTQPVQQQLLEYTLRIIGLIILISAVVTITTMYTVEHLVIGPMLQMRQNLGTATEQLTQQLKSTPQPIQLNWPQPRHTDELSDFFRAVEQLVVQTQHEIVDRYQAETSLAQEVQQSEELQQLLRKLQNTQAQLIHSEKMSSLGQLVAGVAHEINNPVSFIYGNIRHIDDYTSDLLSLIELYQQHHQSPEIEAHIADIDLKFLATDIPKIIESMQLGTNRIKQIVTSLRTFSRMDEADYKTVNIHTGLDSTLVLLERRLRATPSRPAITVTKQYGSCIPIACYAGQLNQVFMNILHNAIDALDTAPSNAPQIDITTSYQADKVTIAIRDNGPGMTQAIQQKVFDPFFTTKTVGQGTGMGMSISYMIVVEQHHGQLLCESTPGKGTTFSIHLPT